MVDFSEYQCFDPGVDRPLDQVSRAEARAHFKLLMKEKENRIEQLKRLVAKYQINLDGSDESIQKLNDWFFDNVEPDPKDSRKLKTVMVRGVPITFEEGPRLKPIWYSVVNDIALFLGEEMIKRSPHLHWEFFTYGKKDLSYHRPVIMGFTKTKNKKLNVDLDWIIGTYGHRIVAGKEEERTFFLRVLKANLEYA